ncbi:zinc ribbon domain-containing protein [Streptomyces jumonjinensis]|uniref:zinc ribbon domain-containing protein n=1 Tax=Streptomyces jumonjinensis TaxID=1945 RepID=UPI00379273FC
MLAVAASIGGHIIGWADDWEVSGAADPMTRPKLGPWLRDERGPYDGLVAAAELRAIQRRNRDTMVRTRAAGRPKGKSSYGFQYVRVVMGGKIDHIALHPHASAVIREVARRVLADPERVTPVALCGLCGNRLYPQTSADVPPRYVCTARNKGWLSAQHCRPAPLIWAEKLDAYVEGWFLREFGDGLIYETVFDPGNGIPERIAEVRAMRERLRADCEAGLYDAADDAAWFRERYGTLSSELASLEREPQRAPGMIRRPTGETVADRWRNAPDVQARKEILMDYRVRVTLFPVSHPVRHVAGVMHGPDRDPDAAR